MLDATISLVGNVIENPNLKVTPNGTYLCSFRIASTARRYDRKENRWVDGSSLFIEVTCWRRLAENVAASLNKGDRALIIGRLRLREFDNAQGERRRRYEIEADAIGPELAWRPARVMRASRGGAGERPAGQTGVPPGTAVETGPVANGEYGDDAQAGPASPLDETTPWADGDLDGDSFTHAGAAPADELPGGVLGEVRPDWSDTADSDTADVR